jgi:hypothetical protein
MLIQRANVYLADPDAIQQAALVQWAHAATFITLGLNNGASSVEARRITYVFQARELTCSATRWIGAKRRRSTRYRMSCAPRRRPGMSGQVLPRPVDRRRAFLAQMHEWRRTLDVLQLPSAPAYCRRNCNAGSVLARKRGSVRPTGKIPEKKPEVADGVTGFSRKASQGI